MDPCALYNTFALNKFDVRTLNGRYIFPSDVKYLLKFNLMKISILAQNNNNCA